MPVSPAPPRPCFAHIPNSTARHSGPPGLECRAGLRSVETRRGAGDVTEFFTLAVYGRSSIPQYCYGVPRSISSQLPVPGFSCSTFTSGSAVSNDFEDRFWLGQCNKCGFLSVERTTASLSEESVRSHRIGGHETLHHAHKQSRSHTPA
jgi:hypothetical protein